MEFRRKNYLELYRDGEPVVASGYNSNRHTELVYAIQHAEKHAQEINKPGFYQVRVDGGLYYVIKITEVVFDSTVDPEIPAPAQAELSLSSSAYAGNENTAIQFTINRTQNTDDRVSVDWAITNANVTPASGTEIFEVGDGQKTVQVNAGEVGPSEVGELTIANPQNLSGGQTPALVSPSTATFTILDTSTSVSAATLRAAGYILVDDHGADPSGTIDSYAAIQAAIDQARNDEKSVWFTRGATYLVSEPIRVFMWDTSGTGSAFTQTAPPQLFGGGKDLSRPVIKLIPGSADFQNTNDPHPVLSFRQFQNFDPAVTGPTPEPADVMDDNGTAQSQANNYFYATFQNIRVDNNKQPGAFGVYFPAAQRCFVADIEIDATDSYGGWEGLLGRNSCITNLKVIGGQYQIRSSARLSSDGSNGINVHGLTLVPDANTITPWLGHTDAVPAIITGFDFTSNGFTGNWIDVQGAGGSVRGCLSFLDGVIRASGGRVVDNSIGKSIYLRNIYVTGTNDLVQSGSRAAVTASGTWKRINEYVYIDQSSIDPAQAEYARQVLVDGSFLTNPEPLTDIDSAVAAPVNDYVAAHTIDIHRIDDGREYVNAADYVTPYNNQNLNASWLYNNSNADVTEPDALAGLQQAIQDAATAGHNRVFLPRGVFFISDTLDLLPDTKMFGCSAAYSKIGQKSSWQPTTDVYTVRTADDANGTCHWSEIQIVCRRWDPNAVTSAPPPAFDNHNWLHWRTGKFSSSVQRINGKEVGVAQNYTGNHNYHYFTGNAGGKHYGFTDDPGRAYYSVDAIGVRIENTTGQPLHIYGYNPEMGKGGPQATEPQTPYCTIIENASNIRIYGTKREGTGHTVKMTNVDNVAYYCGGREHTGSGVTNGISATRHVLGNSDNFQFVLGGVDQTGEVESATDYLSYEDVTGFAAVGIKHPNLCVLHRRGALNDNVMLIT